VSDFAVTSVSTLATEPLASVKAVPDPATPPAQPCVAFPNPELLLDIKVGIAVIQFRSEDGTVTLSIPSQKQLDAYATGAMSTSGIPPSIV
jgi:hypothetical protein